MSFAARPRRGTAVDPTRSGFSPSIRPNRGHRVTRLHLRFRTFHFFPTITSKHMQPWILVVALVDTTITPESNAVPLPGCDQSTRLQKPPDQPTSFDN